MITLCKAIATPSSFHLVVVWVLFENAMSFHRLKAAITGLLEARRVNEWIVTEKLGDVHKAKPAVDEVLDVKKQEDSQIISKSLLQEPKKKPKTRFWQNIYMSEIGLRWCPFISRWHEMGQLRRLIP